MKFSTKTSALAVAALALWGVVGVTPAHAQATRTWVDGEGDDANPCSRTAPCKTFAGAISKTAAGGEINCSGGAISGGNGVPGGAGFGTLTITKAITINCDTILASVLNSGTVGFTINAGANDTVILNGLEINGAGTTTGTKGINFLAGGTLIVRNCLIYGDQTSPAYGISFTPSGASNLTITNTTVATSGAAGVGGGILIQPTGAGGNARVTIQGLRVQNNLNGGLRIDTTGNTATAGVSVSIDNSLFAGNATAGIAVVTPVGDNSAVVTVSDSTVTNNGGTGIIANGAGASIRVGNTTITGNATGVNAAGGSTISSYGDNRLDGNPAIGAPNNGAFSGAVIPKH